MAWLARPHWEERHTPREGQMATGASVEWCLCRSYHGSLRCHISSRVHWDASLYLGHESNATDFLWYWNTCTGT